MSYYRRKPLDVLPVDAARLATQIPGNLASERTATAFAPLPAIDDIASVLPPQTRHEPIAPRHDRTAPQPDPSGADLVARAVEILQKDLAAGALAAAGAPPFLSAMPAFNGDSLAMPNGLPGGFGEFLSAFTQASAQAQNPDGTGLPPLADRIGAPGPAASLSVEDEAVALKPVGTVRAGEQTTIAFKLHNDSFRPVRLALQKTDLTCPSGQLIPQTEISISPPDVSLAPDGTADMAVTIRIPAATPPGIYSGLLTAPALPYLRGLLTVTVTQ